MIKSILVATAVVLTTMPAFSEEIQITPLTKKSSAVFGLVSSYDGPPTISLASNDVPSAIHCRSRAHSKFLELGAKNMSEPDSNSQWGILGSIRAVVWCRGTQAITATAGTNYTSTTELRDEIRKAF